MDWYLDPDPDPDPDFFLEVLELLEPFPPPFASTDRASRSTVKSKDTRRELGEDMTGELEGR